MKEQKYYIKYPLNYKFLFEIIKKLNKKKINFFIDFNSICKGFYKQDTVLFELSEYLEHNKVSGKLLDELKDWLNNLYKYFKNYDPYFIIFYDDGQCLQNKLIMNTYKANRHISNLVIGNDEKSTELFRTIKHYYYLKIKEQFVKPDLCSVFYSHEYETDLIPHYCITNDIFDSQNNDVLNIILSMDKDLLQTTEFENTIQCPTNFKANKETGKYEINFQIYDKNNALSYIYPKFSPGILTAKYLPLVLSLCGDTSDDILGLTGIGPSKAIKLIEKNDIPANLNEIKLNLKIMPQIIQDNISRIILNYKLISFDEQIKRLPKEFLN